MPILFRLKLFRDLLPGKGQDSEDPEETVCGEHRCFSLSIKAPVGAEPIPFSSKIWDPENTEEEKLSKKQHVNVTTEKIDFLIIRPLSQRKKLL